MWELYSRHYFQQNRAAAVSTAATVLTAAGFLSFLYSLGYNLWVYEMQYGNTSITPLVVLFSALLGMTVLSVMLIIRNVFTLSMNPRIHQLGILSSVGATPGQLRVCLIQEAAVVSAGPILLGSLLGIALCYGLMEAVNFFAAGVAGRQDAVFSYRLSLFWATLLTSALTVLAAVWAPAWKLSKLTPIQSIRNARGLHLKKRKAAPLLTLFFGAEGEIAGSSLQAQRKALRTANLSLLLSFLAFSTMLCFTTLSAISTRHTYFERYQNAWDVMVTTKDTDLAIFRFAKEIQILPDVREVAVYQKAESTCTLGENDLSTELSHLGAMEHVGAPVIILDDSSFLAYCAQSGIPPSLHGAILLNQYWDDANSSFRYKKYIPFVKENLTATTLAGRELPVLGSASEGPALREEYPNHTLVHFLPLSLWESLSHKPEVTGTYLRVFARENASGEDLRQIESRIREMLPHTLTLETENRIQEREANDTMIAGMQWIFGAFCALLAVIGIASVFSNTLGFLRSRNREFAQYASIGLTPAQMKKLFAIEAFVIAGRPVFITLPLTIGLVELAIAASYLDSREFWAEAPIGPVCLFAAGIAFFVWLAYRIGGRQLLRQDLNEVLRTDALG